MTSRQLQTVELGDQPDAWRAIGFCVDEAGRLELGSTTLRLQGGGGGFLGWRIEGVDDDIDGLPTIVADPARRTGPTHPNLIRRIDHVVIATGDAERTARAFEAAGMERRRTRTTTRGGSPVTQLFFWAGDVIVEVVAPAEAAPDRAGDGAGFFGMAFASPDLDATVAALGGSAGTPRDAVQTGRRIAGIGAGALGVSIPVAVMSEHPGSRDLR